MPSSMTNKPIVLVAMGAYWPCAGANGPVKSLINLVDALGTDFEFRIVSRDRPFGATTALDSVPTWSWYDGPHGVPVLHIPATEVGIAACRRLLNTTRHDLIYLNGFFDREFSIPMLVARRTLSTSSRTPVIVAPRGEFATDLIARKSYLKKSYVRFARHSGLVTDVGFHATADHEAMDIKFNFPGTDTIRVATNIASPPPDITARTDKQIRRCRLVFSGRIVPKNNLATALDVLARTTCHVTFDVCGPPEDKAVWQLCQQKIAGLPKNITVHAHGALSQADLRAHLLAADGLLQPTLGENFGHAIVEAMQAGLPVIISDRTPWTNLQHEGCGWSLPLDDLKPFVDAVEAIAAMDQSAWNAMSSHARAYSDRVVQREPAINAHRAMFLRALKKQS
jgi:glycosyltransferase involved in cell wall biosynthesis